MTYAVMSRLVDYLASEHRNPHIVEWASPVPYFGALHESVVATVGINPSDREFVDGVGTELRGSARRLHSLSSLHAPSWADVTGGDIARIVAGCDQYFLRNPYRRWFDVLDRLLRSGGATYYSEASLQRSCHLDLCAFATAPKWGQLSSDDRRDLLAYNRSALVDLIRDSPLRLLVLNGRAVVQYFEEFIGTRLAASQVPEWTLRRSTREAVVGLFFEGKFSEVAGVPLDRDVAVIGFNHNLQSSYGVSTDVRESIARAVGDRVASAINWQGRGAGQ